MKNMLESEIKNGLDEITHMSCESKEYGSAVENLKILMDEYLKFEEAEQREEKELEEKKRKLFDRITDAVDKASKILLGIGGIAVPALLSVWGTKMTLKFEETGTVTTIAGREFIRSLFHR